MKNLLNLDFLRLKPEISLNNTNGYKTLTGVLLSIFILFITIYSIRDSFDIYFNKIHPNTSISYTSNNENINLTYKSLPLLISFTTYNLQTHKHDSLDIDSIQDIAPIVYQGKYSNDIYVKNQKYQMNKCNTTDINAYLTNLTSSDPKRFNIEKDFWEAYLKQAKNSFCFQQNESNEVSINTKELFMYDNVMLGVLSNISLSSYSLVVKYPRYYFTPDDKYNSYIVDLENVSFQLPKDKAVYSYSLYFTSINIISDFSEYFITNTKQVTYIQFDKSSTYQTNTLNDNSYQALSSNMIIFINQSNKSIIYNYKYQGLGYLVAYIGGAFQVYTLIVSVIYEALVMFSFNAYLLNSVFSFHYNTNTRIDYDNQLRSLKTLNQVFDSKGKIENLSMKKEKVHEKLRHFLDNKDKYVISSKDVFFTYFNLVFKRNDQKEKVIIKYIDLLHSQYNYSAIVKDSLEAYIHKKINVDNALIKFLTFPSVNLSHPTCSVSLVDAVLKSKNDEIMFDDVKILLEKDLRKDKYVKLFEMFMEKY